MTIFISLCISAPVISNFWYLKVNFLGPENLDRDISSWRLTSALRYQEMTIFISLCISTPVISNYWYLIVNFLGPENLDRDISIWRLTSVLRY